MAAGKLRTGVDTDDLEMSLMRSTLAPHLADRSAGVVPDLIELTELTRTIATAEIIRLSSSLLMSETTDVAVFSTTMIHGPDGDRVSVVSSRLWVGADPLPVILG